MKRSKDHNIRAVFADIAPLTPADLVDNAVREDGWLNIIKLEAGGIKTRSAKIRRGHCPENRWILILSMTALSLLGTDVAPTKMHSTFSTYIIALMKW